MGVNNVASEIALKVRADFVKKNSNLLAIMDKNPEQILSAVMASAELDKTARESVVFYMEGLDQQDPYARKVARESFYTELYRITAQFFCDAMSDGLFKVVTEPPEEASAELTELSYTIGNMKRPAPPPKPKSAAELLDEEIRSDWEKLPADKIRLKENDSRYKKRLRELLDSDAIKSQVSQLHDGREIGG